MGIRFYCPNGHKLNVKSFLAGKRGKCPECDARFQIPTESTNQPVLASQELIGAGTTNAVEIKSQLPKPASTSFPESTAPKGDHVRDVDPISESPNSVWYVRTSTGGQFGPANGKLMREWIAEGRVPGNSLVWRQGWNDWLNAMEVFPSLLGSAPLIDSVPPSIDTISTASPRFRQVKSKRSSAVMVLLLFFACIVLFSVLLFVVLR